MLKQSNETLCIVLIKLDHSMVYFYFSNKMRKIILSLLWCCEQFVDLVTGFQLAWFPIKGSLAYLV